MAKIGGQQGQSPFGILPRPVPSNKSIGRKPVSHVMQTRAMAVGDAAQTDFPGQCIKGSVNLSAIHTIAPVGNKQIGGDGSSCPMTATPGNVICEHSAR